MAIKTRDEMILAAKQIVERIVRDFSDRRGLRQEWENIDADTQDEIRREWESIILAELEAPAHEGGEGK